MPYITDYILILVFGLFYYNKLVRKDVDVNEHERLSNIRQKLKYYC